MTGCVPSVGQPRTNSRRWIKVKAREVRPNIYWVGAIDWNRRLFGSHLATSDLYVTDEGRVFRTAKRYYAEILKKRRPT